MQLELVGALEKAASPVPSLRQAGEASIQQLESNSGFFTSLLSVYLSDQISASSRYLAIIYMKNSLQKNWRKLSFEDKQLLRSQLLAAVPDPATTHSQQMAKQLAVIIATIARHDFPRQWPQLLGDLNQMVIDAANAGDRERLHAVLEAMHQTLKKLATARIGQARVQLNEFSVSQVELYWQIFTTFGNYSALKIVGTLLYDGHDRAHRFPGPQSVFPQLYACLQAQQTNIKIVRRIGKIYERLVEKHPLVFCGFKAPAQQSVQFYCDLLGSCPAYTAGSDDETNDSINTAASTANNTPAPNASKTNSNTVTSGGSAVIVQSMCIIRDLTRVGKLQSVKETSLPLNLRPRDDEDRQDLQTAWELCAAVFVEPLLNTLIDALIQYYFQMTAEDVELWRDDPAEFVIEDSRQNAEFSVVLCAEMLFAHLLRTWPQTVAPRAQSLIEQAVGSGEELKVEAALRALEFGAATFSESFEIEPIIQLVSNQSASPFIRRRVCLVLGGWVPFKEAEIIQPVAFQLVDATLKGDWDIVVQLGALELVRVCCDDIDFQRQSFALASDAVFEVTYRLLRDTTQSTEVKLNVLKVLGTVIEGLGPQIDQTNMAQIMEILPALWNAETEYSNHHLIQGAVLQTLANLLTACGLSEGPTRAKIEESYGIALSMLDVATDPAQPLSAYLMEDGMAVWKAMIVNAEPEVGGRALATLFDRLLLLIETRTEDLGMLLSLLESYMWLDCSLAVPHYNKLFGLLCLYLCDGCAMDESLLILLNVEVIAMLSGPLVSTQYANSLQQTGFLQWMEDCILRADSDDVGVEAMIEAGKCMNILSIISIQTSGSAIIHPETLFPAWLNKIRGKSDPRDRKLCSMGVTALLLAHPVLFQQFTAQYIETMGYIVEEIPDTAGLSQFHPPSSAEAEAFKLNSEEKRQQAARAGEVAVSVGLQAFIKQVAEHLHHKGFPDLGTRALQMGLILP